MKISHFYSVFEIIDPEDASEMYLLLLIAVLVVGNATAMKNHSYAIKSGGVGFAHPCKGVDTIVAQFEGNRPPDEENMYNLNIQEELIRNSEINIQFDSDATVTLSDPSTARIYAYPQSRLFTLNFFKNAKYVGLNVKGPVNGSVPYIKSLKINTVEYCDDPVTIFKIIVHDEFEPKKLSNDIAILKLKSEVVYDDYVQPACLWHADAYKRLPQGQIMGTVVGWGFDVTDRLSTQLQQATIPKVSEVACLRSNPVFFTGLLTDKKFCAGWRNSTSPCNGDSGGGFMVFVPDVSKDSTPNATGAWHVRGVVSFGARRQDAAVCDPNQYVLFTDVAKYRGWILKKME